MIHESPISPIGSQSLPKLPAWVTARSGETAKNIGFLAGASFAMLDLALMQSGDTVPKALFANRLALKAAVATSKLEGRLSREADIRDAYYLTQPDRDGVSHWGPDGDLFEYWRRTVRLRLKAHDWQPKLTEIIGTGSQDHVVEEVDRGFDETRRFGPMAAAVGVMRRVLDANDRAERTACLLADITLARFFCWDRPLPLAALQLTKANLRDLRQETGEARRQVELSVQAALTNSAQSAHRLAADLTSRAEVLRSVAPKLRAKGSDQAVALFLAEDAVAPSGMLSPHIQGTRTPMTARAARRLCDRLVELGAIKELTGRRTFRLYGVAP